MRTKVKGTPGNQSCTVLNSKISGKAKSNATVGVTEVMLQVLVACIVVQGCAWDAVPVWYDTEVMCVPNHRE